MLLCVREKPFGPGPGFPSGARNPDEVKNVLIPMFRLLLAAVFVVLSGLPLRGQGDPAGVRKDIAFYADVMVNAVIPEHRERARSEMVARLEGLLGDPASASVSLDSIRGLSVLHGPDFRLVTWQHRVSDSLFQYGGFLQTPLRVTWLRDTRPFLNGSAYSVYTPDAWYGCLYYDLIPFEREGREYYILLGFHAQDGLFNTKLADVLDLSDGKVRLGVPVFTGQERPMTRLILDYADASTVTIRYDAELQALVHDHLETLPGIGPHGEPLPVADGSLEGWILRRGEWNYEEKMFDVILEKPPMTEERLERKEDRDILGRPKKQ